MKRRIAKKKAKKSAAEAIQKAARQRETAMAADLAETYDRLMETEDRLLQARKDGRELKVQLSFTQREATKYRLQVDEYRDYWVQARKQARWNTKFYGAAGVALGIACGYMVAFICWLK